MTRRPDQLDGQTFDVLVVGGGIYGAFIAWDAALRGLSVALIERDDFGSGTSANSLKVIHGGLRYLQHGDWRRVRTSIHERSTLLRIAPHLVHPLPVLVPTYGHGLRGREAFGLALALNDAASWDRNQGQRDPAQRLPRGKLLSRRELLDLAPDVAPRGLTGGALFFDAQLFNAERLPLAVLRSAVAAGAQVANYVEATGFLRRGQRVVGVQALDRLAGHRFPVRARVVVNAVGPWLPHLLRGLTGAAPALRHAKAINLVTRPLHPTHALGLWSEAGRFLFVTPWRDGSLVGTAYFPCDDAPDALRVTEAEIASFVAAVNRAFPAARLRPDEVRWVHSGLLPLASLGSTADPQLARHARIVDHREEGIEGLISVVGVKFTTARHVAAQIVDLLFERWGQRPPPCRTAHTPVFGGDTDCFSRLAERAARQLAGRLEGDALHRLLRHHGAAWREVLPALPETQPLSPHALWEAEVRYSVREEMAQSLDDVLFRRTGVAAAGWPGDDLLWRAAQVMAEALGWSAARQAEEVRAVAERFPALQGVGGGWGTPVVPVSLRYRPKT